MENRALDLDRLLADDYLTGLEQLPLAEVRGRKGECDRTEVALSYLRRLVQGRLDIVHAELQSRAGGGHAELSDIIEQLPEILSERGRGGGGGRLPSLVAPDVNHRLLTADLDRVMDIDKVGALPAMGDDEVAAVADRLAQLEREVSAVRRALHERIDALQAEIVRRYQSGEASVDSLLR